MNKHYLLTRRNIMTLLAKNTLKDKHAQFMVDIPKNIFKIKLIK